MRSEQSASRIANTTNVLHRLVRLWIKYLRCSLHCFCLGLVVTACRPVDVQYLPERAIPSAEVMTEPSPSLLSHPAAESLEIASAISPPRIAKWSAGGISFEGVTFDSRSHRLVVVDQQEGPGSRFSTAAHAARSVGGIAAVNAGFFTPEGEPLGLVVSQGHATGQWNGGSSLGSGVWHETTVREAKIVRRESLHANAARRMPELLQSGPMLVDGGKTVKGLRGGEPRSRTLIAWDGRHQWWIGCASPCALPDLATALIGAGGPGFTVRTALNLDGGRSSELWVGSGIAGGPLTRRTVWNRTVRNHLALIPR